jgi:CP family cyanate transporter-like MFS transporter
VVVVAALVVAFAPRPGVSSAPLSLPARRWWPDWKDPLVQRLGILFGSVTSVYFGANAFIPHYFDGVGRPGVIAGALSALNFGQLPAALLLLAGAPRVERRAWPYMLAAVLTGLGILGLVFAGDPWTTISAGVIGFCCGGCLTLVLTLPPLLSAPEDVARTSAGMFTIAYLAALVVAIACGVAWDASGIPALAFVPMGLCTASLLGTAAVLRAERRLL